MSEVFLVLKNIFPGKPKPLNNLEHPELIGSLLANC